MLIPVFVSCPTALNARQERSRQMILAELKHLQLEPRALGRTDYPTELPLREVYVIAKHCSGGVILGFEQSYAAKAVEKRGVRGKAKPQKDVIMPTPWNHLEAGILFGMNLPLLVFREKGISGGVFDVGVTDNFVHPMPTPKLDASERTALTEVFLKWQFKVRDLYYK
jgi:hypothetical protein